MAPSAAPDHPVDQRHSALKRANEIRIARAKLKQQLRDGKVHIGPILSAPPEHIATAKVLDLLVAVPKLGPARAARLLTKAQISQMKTVGGLSERQRAHLIELLRA
jgi:hypothetical protein